MSPRTGRPKSENPKDVRFSIRLDANTFAELRKYCEQKSITVAEAIREAIDRYLAMK